MARGRQKAVRANGQATQERIMDAAEELFADGGYEATSLRQIAATAEVDIATLKYHFRDKPALFGEVYRRGHEAFMEVLDPFVDRLDSVDSTEAMAELMDDLVVEMHDFLEDNLAFVRLTLYRMLENSEDVISIEEELQVVAISLLDDKFKKLVERGIIRPVDTRALVVFLVSSFSTWHVTGRVKTQWLGKPGLGSDAGRARSEEFFIGLLERWLL
jgi:AcrR family transcriptional regulator